MAKAVVVHIMFFLRSLFFELFALDTIVCLGEKEVHGDEVNPFKKLFSEIKGGGAILYN